MNLYQENMKSIQDYNIPVVNKELSTRNILTSTFIPGDFILTYENAE